MVVAGRALAAGPVNTPGPPVFWLTLGAVAMVLAAVYALLGSRAARLGRPGRSSSFRYASAGLAAWAIFSFVRAAIRT